MHTAKSFLLLPFLFFLASLPNSFALQTPSEQTPLVGHITHIEGDLSRYTPDVDDWVATVIDAPCGTDDILYADTDARAELIMPNNSWIRIGNDTQIHITRIESDLTAIDLESGTARLYNKSPTATIKTSTPFGTITSPPHTTCDLYLEEDSLLVTALEGSVDFLHVSDNTHYGVTAGLSSLKADLEQASTSDELLDGPWNEWNEGRDELWEKRLAEQGDSSNYLPDNLQYGSYALDENGIWENVYYEGSRQYLWRPRCVSSGWAPFTRGRWTEWYGDHCWVPCEPFGYVTHHYGNWVYIDSCRQWYWAPPVCGPRVSRGSFRNIGSGWYPGRVSWINRGCYVGWIPLAPFEPYYCRRYWGPRSCTLPARRKSIEHFDTKHCRYRNHSVIVRKTSFYKTGNYSTVRVKKINNNFIDNYHRTTHINGSVIRNFKENRQRFNFGKQYVNHKPDRTIAKGIRQKRKGGSSSFRKDSAPIGKTLVKRTPSRPGFIRKPGNSPRTFSADKRKRPERRSFKKQSTKRSWVTLPKSRARRTPGKKLVRSNQRRTLERVRLPAGLKRGRSRQPSSLQTLQKRGASRLKQQRTSRTPQLKLQRQNGISRVRGGIL